MQELIVLKCDPTKIEDCTQKLSDAIGRGAWVQLLPKSGKRISLRPALLPKGPGVIITSGGTCGGPHECLQPCSNLEQSAFATGQWLKAQGVDPKKCLILNPLPLHHVSGLMPWWRSRSWGSNHIWVMPSLMRNPDALNEVFKSLFEKAIGRIVISLVPTQLQRLLTHPAGVHWLKSFEVVWIGGSSLPKELALIARNEGIRLAPCYGSTETAAMVTALSPQDFLAGRVDCGNPLDDVDLSIDQNRTLKIKTPRLAPVQLKDGRLRPLQERDGWWHSGDAAKLIRRDNLLYLDIVGRIDTAINSGGETVFPEQLEARLIEAIKIAELPIQALIFLPIENAEWGQRLVVLLRWEKKLERNQPPELILTLQNLVKEWLPAERPVAWYHCQELATNEAGKWERQKWIAWLNDQQKAEKSIQTKRL